jgi:5-formyltetrahydrofolate cyclo-ligase
MGEARQTAGRPGVPVSKRELRRAIKARLAAQPGAYFNAQGIAAAALMGADCHWETQGTILLFLSTVYEIDTSPLLELALEGGKRVFVPRLVEGKMVFCRIRSLTGPWETGPLGIREPVLEGQTLPGGNSSLTGEDFPALIIVPGLAFDTRGRRLGRGGAYYDRFLAGLEAAGRPYRTIGLCTACQLVPEVPVDTWDKNMDYLCTGEKLFSVCP